MSHKPKEIRKSVRAIIPLSRYLELKNNVSLMLIIFYNFSFIKK